MWKHVAGKLFFLSVLLRTMTAAARATTAWWRQINAKDQTFGFQNATTFCFPMTYFELDSNRNRWRFFTHTTSFVTQKLMLRLWTYITLLAHLEDSHDGNQCSVLHWILSISVPWCSIMDITWKCFFASDWTMQMFTVTFFLPKRKCKDSN